MTLNISTTYVKNFMVSWLHLSIPHIQQVTVMNGSLPWCQGNKGLI